MNEAKLKSLAAKLADKIEEQSKEVEQEEEKVVVKIKKTNKKK